MAYVKNKWFNREYNESKYFDPEKKSSKPSPQNQMIVPLTWFSRWVGDACDESTEVYKWLKPMMIQNKGFNFLVDKICI